MSVSTTAQITPRARLTAIAIMCLASLCFITMHGFIKTVRGDVPIGMIIWSQYTIQAVLLTALLAPRLRSLVTTRMLGLQVLRALALMAAVSGMFVAVGLMPLADAITIAFVAPLMITAAAAFFLKERVTPGQWLAILVGFGGVLIVIRPGTSIFEAASLVPLGAAVSVALYQTLTRPISQVVKPVSMLYMATLVGLVVSALALPFVWETPDLTQTAYLGAAACLGAAAHFLLIRAYHAAPASVVAPFAYTEIVWSSAIGFAVFGDIPDSATLIGAAVLIASGLYLLRAPRT
ncbi:MAG: DMT family transporter [Rhodospirillaceae bacterium]|jgi:drug/metabolite transporter (DMT)-like permease|nr:DMT family transporter [Rhodospirillaceae bacterium]MBT3809170.1 DMT family transporter [Rhodospirillaceae bacterium]MBT3931451.1 DMT family transporter [Rhodospirillaceae bacterium]MBT4773399.1 DMT family transporter [Rhodospirillaceae bacterium]MBT5359783.1 DMT family transporter [Rhodospirillaceae bacterium]